MRELAGCVQVVADEVGAFPRRFNIAGVDQVAPGAHLESYDVLDDPFRGIPELLVMTLPESLPWRFRRNLPPAESCSGRVPRGRS